MKFMKKYNSLNISFHHDIINSEIERLYAFNQIFNFFLIILCINIKYFMYLISTSSTSLSGGNLVDGLPPVASFSNFAMRSRAMILKPT